MESVSLFFALFPQTKTPELQRNSGVFDFLLSVSVVPPRSEHFMFHY